MVTFLWPLPYGQTVRVSGTLWCPAFSRLTSLLLTEVCFLQFFWNYFFWQRLCDQDVSCSRPFSSTRILCYNSAPTTNWRFPASWGPKGLLPVYSWTVDSSGLGNQWAACRPSSCLTSSFPWTPALERERTPSEFFLAGICLLWKILSLLISYSYSFIKV